jgi:DNA-binding GntR family transcriptional regulator
VASSEGDSIDQLRQISVRSAADAAADMLRKAIISGALKPGERLVEQRLASKLGIGQPTLREALKELEYQGFVRKTPQRGTYVTKLCKEDYRKILEVRIVLEGLAIASAARNLNSGIESELDVLVSEMQSTTASGDLAKFHDRDVQFHRKIWDLADNEYLTRALETTAFQLFAFALLDLGPDILRQRHLAVAQHQAILEGLRSRDPATARLAFISHTVKYWNDLYHVDLSQEELVSVSSIR